jgi:AAA+ superfamily predicted ATPase
MSSIKYLKDCFSEIDPSIPIEIGGYEENEYFDSILLNNAVIVGNSTERIKDFLGGVECRIVQIPGKQQCRIDISKVDLNKSNLDARDYIEFMKQNRGKGWFIGLGHFGPEFYDFNHLTHSQVSGTSGYGKSSFFKFLLAQTLAFQPKVVNYIIDPKKVDFPILKDHPNVALIAHESDEWKSILTIIMTELVLRETIFNESFRNPPDKLSEYWKFKEETKREELPDFPRIMVWIDEYHMLKKDNLHSIEADVLEFIARKGRAFGIHLICSSQRYSDINYNIRGQLNSSFYFYDTSPSASIMEWDNLPKNLRCPLVNKVGRVHYTKQSDPAEFINVQVPSISSIESLIIAYGESAGKAVERRQGTLPLTVDERYLGNTRHLGRLLAGETIRNFALKDAPRMGLAADFNFKFKEVYQIKDARVPPDKKDSNDQDENEDKFDALLTLRAAIKGDVADAEKKTKVQETTTVPRPEQELLIQFPFFDQYDNGLSLMDISSKYQTFVKCGRGDFKLFLKSANEFTTLRVIKKILQANISNKDLNIRYSDLALSSEDRTLLDRYMEETKINIKADRPIPMLIISGEEGVGKATITRAIAEYLKAVVRTASSKDTFVTESLPEEQDKVVKYVIFSEPDAAINYNRHCPNNEGVILIHTVSYDVFGRVQNTPDYKYFKDYHVHINLTESDYREKEVFQQLLKALLHKHAYVGELTKEITQKVSETKINVRPMHLDSVIERASRRALHLGKPFDSTVLNLTLNEIKVEGAESNNEVKIVKPKLTLDDIVLNHEALEDLKDVIYRARNLEGTEYAFARKVIRSNRVVALFAGPPGTGKSMAAEVIAFECQKPLWMLDFGKMQSPYVGVTEMILSNTFNMAETAEAVLLLDECDAFLGERSAGKNEYNNRITNHLLNLILNFSGVLILTTNNPDFLDGAFSRRCDVKSIFASPNEEGQIRILKKLLEPDAPLESDFSYEAAIKGFRLSGGLLRNAVERMITKMQRQQVTTLSTAFVRSVLEETSQENEILIKEKKKISL